MTMQLAASQGVESQGTELTFRFNDGSERHIYGNATPLRQPDGTVYGAISAFIDITELKKAEEALRLSEKRFRRFATSDIIGIVFADVHGSLNYVNDEYLRIIGYTREQFETSRLLWTEMTPPEWRPADEKGLAEARGTGTCIPYEKEYIRRDGSRIPVLIGYTCLDESGDELVAFILDLTERKRSEQALQDSDRRKDEFLAMLAHELRNPLAAIRTAVHILSLKGSAQPELTWGRQVIERQAKHLTRLIEDLLDVSRISTGKIQLQPVPIDFRDVASRAAESVLPLMTAKQHDLRILLPARPLSTVADPARLEQVVNNLLTNAAKYTDNGGSITLTAAQEGPSIVLRLRDNGIGIAPEMLPHIFDLYIQVDGNLARSLGGLGIGLKLVKMLVELHGGSVAATSEGPGKGSEFTIRLPARDSPPQPPDDAGQGELSCPEPSAMLWRRRVLVVDDNVDIALGLAMLLESSSHEVKTAHDGPSALEIARQFRPEFVVMDIGLPGMNGYELANAFQAEDVLRGATLIAISGFGQHHDRERARAAGFDHHMLKPVDLAMLLPILAAGAGAGRFTGKHDPN